MKSRFADSSTSCASSPSSSGRPAAAARIESASSRAGRVSRYSRSCRWSPASAVRSAKASSACAAILICASRSNGLRGPGGGEVAPFRQAPGGSGQAAGRLAGRRRRVETTCRATAQRAADTLGRVGQRFLQPAVEGAVEQPARIRLRQHLEAGIHLRLDRPLAHQVGAEAVDRAHLRVLQARDGVVQVRRRPVVAARALQLLAQAQLQLAGRLFP